MVIVPFCFPSVDSLFASASCCSMLHIKEQCERKRSGRWKVLWLLPTCKSYVMCFVMIGFHLRMLPIKCLLHRSAQSPSDLWHHLPHVLPDELPSLKAESWSLMSGCNNWQHLEKGSLMGWPDLILLLPACSDSETFILQLHILAAWMCRWLVLCKSYLYLLYATKINTLYKNGSVAILFKAPFFLKNF